MRDVIRELDAMRKADRQCAGLEAFSRRHQLAPHRIAALAVEQRALDDVGQGAEIEDYIGAVRTAIDRRQREGASLEAAMLLYEKLQTLELSQKQAEMVAKKSNKKG